MHTINTILSKKYIKIYVILKLLYKNQYEESSKDNSFCFLPFKNVCNDWILRFLQREWNDCSKDLIRGILMWIIVILQTLLWLNLHLWNIFKLVFSCFAPKDHERINFFLFHVWQSFSRTPRYHCQNHFHPHKTNTL